MRKKRRQVFKYPKKITLEKILAEKPLTYFALLERYVNDKKHSPFAKFTRVKNKFQPNNNVSYFYAPCFLIPKNRIKIHCANPSKDVKEEFIKDKVIHFTIHPQMLSNKNFISRFSKLPKKNKYKVVPTSSTRTLITLNTNTTYFLKTHLDIQISRFRRSLRKKSLLHSILISQDLEQAIQKNKVPKSFGFLPETLGFIFNDNLNYPGMIVREFTPRPIFTGKQYLIPFFSLHSKNLIDKNSINSPLLIQIINHNESRQKTRFFLDKIIFPLIETWAYLAFERGLIFEPHGQNVYLELDKSGMPTRIIHKDFQTLVVDSKIRKSKNLSTNFPIFVSDDKDTVNRYKIEQLYSLSYDLFLGHHLLDSLIKEFCISYSVDSPQKIKAQIKDHFRNLIKDNLDRFPKKGWFHYKNKIFLDNNPILEYEKSQPVYR